MTGYNLVNLAELIDAIGEERTQTILSSYYCELNRDVEDFLKHKAIEFARQGIAATYLVFTSYRDKPVLCGYFALASKVLTIPKKSISKRLAKRISKFGQRNTDTKSFTITAPLIAQLGKNFAERYNELITGDELLKMACEKILKIQIQLSGRVTYIECVDEPKLIEFYKSNGFNRVADRYLNAGEKGVSDPDYYVQLIRYLKPEDFNREW